MGAECYKLLFEERKKKEKEFNFFSTGLKMI